MAMSMRTPPMSDNNDKKEPLKPCPFCGNEADFGSTGPCNWAWCNCIDPDQGLVDVNTWNNRPEEDRLRERIVALEHNQATKYWDGIRDDNTKLKAEITRLRAENERLIESNQNMGDMIENGPYHPTCETCDHWTESSALCSEHDLTRGYDEYCSAHTALKKEGDSDG